MEYDEMQLDKIGDRKIALFIIISDADEKNAFDIRKKCDIKLRLVLVLVFGGLLICLKVMEIH